MRAADYGHLQIGRHLKIQFSNFQSHQIRFMSLFVCAWSRIRADCQMPPNASKRFQRSTSKCLQMPPRCAQAIDDWQGTRLAKFGIAKFGTVENAISKLMKKMDGWSDDQLTNNLRRFGFLFIFRFAQELADYKSLMPLQFILATVHWETQCKCKASGWQSGDLASLDALFKS